MPPRARSARAGAECIVMGRVKNAHDCQLEVLSRQSFPVVYSHNPTTLPDRGFFGSCPHRRQPEPAQAHRGIRPGERDGKLSSTGAFYVSLAPLLAPSVLYHLCHPEHARPARVPGDRNGPGKERPRLPIGGAVTPIVPGCLFPQPDHPARTGLFRLMSSSAPTRARSSAPWHSPWSHATGSLSSTGVFYVSLALRPSYLPPPPPPPPPPLPSRYTPGSTGYDVSWPQCQAPGSALTKPLPNAPTFAVVGINDGTIGGFNSCTAEAAWAGQGLSVYIILQPAPSGSRAAFETSGPKSSSAATNQQCAAYNWGYNYAETQFPFARAQSVKPQIWWLDVETAEGWGTSTAAQPANGAVVQGALDALTGAGETAIFCTWYQWGQITGSYTPAAPAPIWVAGATSLGNGYYGAQSYCQRGLAVGDPSTLASKGIGFAGGTPWLVRSAYTPGPVPVDNDYACG